MVGTVRLRAAGEAMVAWLEGIARADELVDLGELGFESFTPYLVERSPYWVLLPLAALLVVLWHLRAGRER